MVSVIFGGLSLQALEDFNKDPSAEKADKQDGYSLAAGLSISLGFVFGVTGIVLLLTDSSPAPPDPKKAPASPTPAKKTTRSSSAPTVLPYAHPHGGGAAVRFEF